MSPRMATVVPAQQQIVVVQAQMPRYTDGTTFQSGGPGFSGGRPVLPGEWTYDLGDCCKDLLGCGGRAGYPKRAEDYNVVRHAVCVLHGKMIHMLNTGEYSDTNGGHMDGAGWLLCCAIVPAIVLGLACSAMVGIDGACLVPVACPFQLICGLPHRAALRRKFGLPSSCAPDVVVWWFCPYCAVCQEYKEMRCRLPKLPPIVTILQAPVTGMMPVTGVPAPISMMVPGPLPGQAEVEATVTKVGPALSSSPA